VEPRPGAVAPAADDVRRGEEEAGPQGLLPPLPPRSQEVVEGGRVRLAAAAEAEAQTGEERRRRPFAFGLGQVGPTEARRGQAPLPEELVGAPLLVEGARTLRGPSRDVRQAAEDDRGRSVALQPEMGATLGVAPLGGLLLGEPLGRVQGTVEMGQSALEVAVLVEDQTQEQWHPP